MITDNFNRKINYLRISVTDKCNLRCLYCMPETGVKLFSHNEILSIEDILFFVKTASEIGVEKIRLTGGEPLIRKNIFHLISQIASLPKIKDISLTTNGVLLKDSAQQLLDSGIKRINISLDTLKRDKFLFITRRDLFDNVIEGISEAVKIGLNPLKINVVAIKNFNHNEVIDFVDFGIQNNLFIRFIEFMPFGNSHDLRFISKRELIDILQSKYSLIEEPSSDLNSPSKNYKISGTENVVGFISPMTEHFCKNCNRLRVTSNGEIKTCLFSDKSYNLSDAIKKHDKDYLINKLTSVIKEKPEKHFLSINDYKFKKCQNEMSKIGG